MEAAQTAMLPGPPCLRLAAPSVLSTFPPSLLWCHLHPDHSSPPLPSQAGPCAYIYLCSDYLVLMLSGFQSVSPAGTGFLVHGRQTGMRLLNWSKTLALVHPLNYLRLFSPPTPVFKPQDQNLMRHSRSGPTVRRHAGKGPGVNFTGLVASVGSALSSRLLFR